MWQQQSGIAKYDRKFHIFLFHHHHNIWASSTVGVQPARRLDHRYIVHLP
jgi:hypothetical protein